MKLKGSKITRIVWRVLYTSVASKLPTWSKWGKRFRVECARRFCEYVHPTANINKNAILSRRITVGPHGGIGEGSVLSGEVAIGPHVRMGPNCRFITGDHPIPPDYGSFGEMTPTHRAIVIEQEVFIGASAIFLPGVRVGRGAAVGAGAVVAKDVPAGSVVVGNPARVIKMRKV